MKKSVRAFVSVLSSVILAVSALPLGSFAEENVNGNINGDGIVNSDDHFMVLEYYAKNVAGRLDEILETDIENVLKYGDINGDGEIDAGDAGIICDIAEKTIDINGNGEINIDDAMYIYNFAMDIDSHTLEEIEALTKLTARVKYYPDREYIKPDLINYAFSLARSATGLKSGDVNGDGAVNSSDAADVLTFYSDVSSGNVIDKDSDEYKYIMLLGDMNENCVVNSSDASEILCIYAEMSAGKIK